MSEGRVLTAGSARQWPDEDNPVAKRFLDQQKFLLNGSIPNHPAVLLIRSRGSSVCLRQSVSILTPSDRIGFGTEQMILSANMPTEHIVALLVAERDKLNRAIEALQGTKKRGRPPKNMAPVTASARATPTPRKGMSAAARRAHSLRMKAYWAKRKKQPNG
jgi:hypothetical protein